MRRVSFAAVVAVVALVLPAVAAAPSRADAYRDAARAVASYDAMQRYLFDRRAGHYREEPGGPPTAQAWPFGQALAAAVAVAGLPSERVADDAVARIRGLERYRTGDAYAAWPGGSIYFDDNEWIAEALLDWSATRSDALVRARAVALFRRVAGAWDDNARHPCPGGVFWTDAPGNRDRNTVTTGNAALLALRLYEVTRDRSYLAWTRKSLEWVERCMRAPNRLYWDHIDLAGNVNRAQWSYNQGILIGAYVRLYRATGDEPALARAEEIADAALDHFDRRWAGDEPPEFAAVFFRHLIQLAEEDDRRDYVAAAAAYGDLAWRRKRDGRTGLFAISGRPRLLEQAALVQLYAALARSELRADGSAPRGVAAAP